MLKIFEIAYTILAHPLPVIRILNFLGHCFDASGQLRQRFEVAGRVVSPNLHFAHHAFSRTALSFKLGAA